MSTNRNMAIQSAQTVSVLRAIASRENDPRVQCSDYLAKHFLTDKYRLLLRFTPHRLLTRYIDLTAPGSYCFMISRTRHFDLIMLEQIAAGVRQVVLLGAGYDTRALRFADKLANIKTFELDFPGTQVYKTGKLGQLCNGLPYGVTFIPIDFNKDPFDKALVRHGFSSRLKTLFLWEGVSYYLPEAVVKKVLQFVGSCGAGSSILFDYATRDFIDGDQGTYGGKQIRRWLEKIREPFLFGMNANETAGFLADCNLSMVSDYGPEDFENMYLRTSKGRLLGRTLGHVRMAHAIAQ